MVNNNKLCVRQLDEALFERNQGICRRLLKKNLIKESTVTLK
jgi:hypothetical protein